MSAPLHTEGYRGSARPQRSSSLRLRHNQTHSLGSGSACNSPGWQSSIRFLQNTSRSCRFSKRYSLYRSHDLSWTSAGQCHLYPTLSKKYPSPVAWNMVKEAARRSRLGVGDVGSRWNATEPSRLKFPVGRVLCQRSAVYGQLRIPEPVSSEKSDAGAARRQEECRQWITAESAARRATTKIGLRQKDGGKNMETWQTNWANESRGKMAAYKMLLRKQNFCVWHCKETQRDGPACL